MNLQDSGDRPRFSTISFLSDFGHADEFVGVVHSVIRSIAPRASVLDITHGIADCDVRAGGLALARSADYLVPGVVMAVVDPGVGTNRRAIALEVGDGQSYLVGPDNGLLAPVVALVGGATAAVTLDNPTYQLQSPGSTFDGRDIFAPAAAHLANGVPIEELGNSLETTKLTPGLLPVAEETADGSINAEVLWVDKFGNLQLNVDPSQIEGWGSDIRLMVGSQSFGTSPQQRTLSRVESFADVGSAGLGMMTDSNGLCSVVADRASAAVELGLSAGDAVELSPVDGPDPQTKPVRVSLGATDGGRESVADSSGSLAGQGIGTGDDVT